MKKIVLTEQYYGHTLQVTIDKSTHNGKMEFIPDKVKEIVFEVLQTNQKSGEFTESDTGFFDGTWRILEFDAQLIYRIVMWKYNHYQEDALSKEHFIRYFGVVDGSHFWDKWIYTFKKDFLSMIAYFGKYNGHAQTFCDMTMNLVESYEQRFINSKNNGIK